MRLLVQRDKNYLASCDGEPVLSSNAPEFLRTPRYIPQKQVMSLSEKPKEDDLLIACREDYRVIDAHLKSRPNGAYPGIWSGRRSAIVQDLETKRLYKLKGVSLYLGEPQEIIAVRFPNGFFRINGGQKMLDARYEMEKSELFNKVLQDEGMKPAMQYVGMWKYPILVKGRRPVASICEIEGDTRLDELMCVIESSAKRHMRDGDHYYTFEGSIFNESIQRFYYNVGHAVGGLKRLMDRSGQTWSCQGQRTNAHIGNVVLWREKSFLRVGLVDFDASMTPKELSKSEIRAIQEGEYKSIIDSVPNFSSPRPIGFLSGEVLFRFSDWMQKFVEGFEKGYKSSRKGKYSNELPFDYLDEIFTLLRSMGSFTRESNSNIDSGSNFSSLEEILDWGSSSWDIMVQISTTKDR